MNPQHDIMPGLFALLLSGCEIELWERILEAQLVFFHFTAKVRHPR
jgi:hypothetical protein